MKNYNAAEQALKHEKSSEKGQYIIKTSCFRYFSSVFIDLFFFFIELIKQLAGFSGGCRNIWLWLNYMIQLIRYEIDCEEAIHAGTLH